jgi:hypothetical protein
MDVGRYTTKESGLGAGRDEAVVVPASFGGVE